MNSRKDVGWVLNPRGTNLRAAGAAVHSKCVECLPLDTHNRQPEGEKCRSDPVLSSNTPLSAGPIKREYHIPLIAVYPMCLRSKHINTLRKYLTIESILMSTACPRHM